MLVPAGQARPQVVQEQSDQCYKWHVIVDGDNCSLLQNTLGVTVAQLTAWSPDLKADCTNLLLGEAYCVQGPSLPPTGSTTARSKPSSSAAGQKVCVQYNAPATCYRVAQGDTCSKIWGSFVLSEVQFRALNSWVDAACEWHAGEGLCIG